MATQWGSELSQGEIAAIDVAVRVTGQQTVTDLQTRLTNVQGALGVLKQQYAQNLITQRDFLEQVQQLTLNQDKLAASISRAQNQLKGLGKEIHLTGQAGLQLGYALDDIQYGFSAIVNNVPGIVQSLGGSAGLAGGLGVAFVAANILSKAMPDLSYQFKELGRSLDLTRDPIRDATSGLKGLKEVRDAIQEKPLKLDADYQALRKLTEEIEAAERAQSHFDALRNKRSEAQEEAAKQVDMGVRESGGAANVENALIAIAKKNGTYGAGSDIVGKIREQQDIMEGQKGQYNDAGPAGMLSRFIFDRANAEAAKLRKELDDEQRQKIRSTLNLNMGDASRVTLQGLAEDPRNAGAFAANQVDLLRLQSGLAGAAPDRLFEHERNKAEKQKQKAAQDKQAAADRQAEIEQQQTDREVEQAENHAQALSERIAAEENRNMDAQARENAKMRRDEATLRGKNQREAAAAAKAAARDAPKIAEHARDMGFAQDFQAMTGATNAQANYAGKQIGNLVDKGANPHVAAQQVYDQMMRVILKQQANMDMLTGVNSGAIQQLRMLDAQADNLRQRIQGVGGNQRRMGNQRPTRGIPF